MNDMVPPGLYAIGHPTPASPVLVTANYKMSYDRVRSALNGRNCWLLVLETYGINVWCAAGRETFGTEELIRRIGVSELTTVVSHRQLILPILGASGVAAHEVTKRTGFSIHYAAIRAGDLPAYLDNGMVTTPAMRELTFTLRERMVLIPVELVQAMKPAVVAAVILFAILAMLQGSATGFKAASAYVGAILSGVVVTPLLLPWLPGPSFALKGGIVGLLLSLALWGLSGGSGWSLFTTISAFLILPSISAFYALNFTGCTPFTSRSGVRKEMRFALPIMACAFLAGMTVAVLGVFL